MAKYLSNATGSIVNASRWEPEAMLAEGRTYPLVALDKSGGAVLRKSADKAFALVLGGAALPVSFGQWIVRDSKGKPSAVLSDAAFRSVYSKYEPPKKTKRKKAVAKKASVAK